MSFGDIKNKVEQHDGVWSVSMVEVKEAYGAKRLGIIVRANITDGLHGEGLAHYPEVLPDSQEQWVTLYKMGSPAERLFQAVLSPGPGSADQIRAGLSSEAELILKEVRELVCPDR